MNHTDTYRGFYRLQTLHLSPDERLVAEAGLRRGEALADLLIGANRWMQRMMGRPATHVRGTGVAAFP